MALVESILTAARSIVPGSELLINKLATNRLSTSTNPRPNTHSLWSPKGAPATTAPADYLTWHSVTDREFFDLHLKPADADYVASLPDNTPTQADPFGPVTALFARSEGFKEGRSSTFFMMFAQWFTDGFFRSNPFEERKTTSTHNIDLAQIYGANEEIACLLRSGNGGMLRHQLINSEQYPDDLGEMGPDGQWQVKDIYKELPYVKDKAVFDKVFGTVPNEQRFKLFATGLERGNSILGHNCFSTLFLREHNNLCIELAQQHPDWDDNRLFHTARIINTVILMKLVIEDYVNHIAGLDVLRLDPSFAEKERWYRRPWIAAEFNLLYRWHSLIPDALQFQGRSESLVRNFSLLREQGLNAILEAATQQPAGKIMLGNVPEFMLPQEAIMIAKGRDWHLPSYNAYREQFKLTPLKSFDQFTSNTSMQTRLKDLYGTPDQVELTVGLFAEKSTGSTLTGDLLTRMVAYDALTQVYTNPLLAKKHYNEQHFTKFGMERIKSTKSFQDLIGRNTNPSVKVSLQSPYA